MILYKKVSSLIKKVSPESWLYIKSLISFFRRAIKILDFPVAYYPTLKAVYLQVPKTATSTTLSLFLKKLSVAFDEKNYHSIHASSVQFFINKRELGKLRRDRNVFTFAFVRNPYTRLISCYQDKIKKEQDTDIMNDYFGVFNPEMSFAEFVDRVCKIPNFWANTHFKSQSSFVFFGKMAKPDFIGKFENYLEDIGIISDKLGLPPLEKSFNITGSTYVLADWYTEDLARKVYKKFRRDFKVFDYSKNI